MEQNGQRQDAKIDRKIRENIFSYGSLGGEALSERIRKLDGEWDLDRCLEVGGSGIGLMGILMGVLNGRIWRVFTVAALVHLFLYGTRRQSPLAATLRRRGIRTRQEIDEEKFALKAMRGDFQGINPPQGQEVENLAKVSTRVLEAVKA